MVSRAEAVRNMKSPQNLQKRKEYYFEFRMLHIIFATVLLLTSLAIIIAAATGDLSSKVYITNSALRRNLAPPPGLFTEFNIISSSHLFWVALFIPLISGLYHLVLALPGPTMNWIQSFGMSPDDYARKMAGGEVNDYDELPFERNNIYLAWFDLNLIYGAAGLKHIPYGLCSGLFVILVGELVGITEIFQLIALFIFVFFGFMMFWWIEYNEGEMLRRSFRREKRGGDAKKGRLRPIGEEETIFDDVVDVIGDAYDVTTDTFERLQDSLFKSLGSWLPFTSAVISIMYVIAVTMTYFGVMVSENSNAIEWSVYLAVSYFIAYIAITLLLMWLHHMDVVIFEEYLRMEMFLNTIHAIAYAAIPLAVVLQTRNQQFLYGISV